MANNSSIEWTESTWNPVTGCTRVSKGCDLCYAATMTKRLAAMGQEKYRGLINPGKGHFNGVVKTHPDTLQIPLQKGKATTFFVNSMSDLFHREVPQDFILDVFEVMACTPQHTFQVLTKRPERMQELMPKLWARLSERLTTLRQAQGTVGELVELPLPNVWLGTSVEDAEVLYRIHHLAETPAAVRFLSCEPLLGPLHTLPLEGIHWVIVGGESGPGARPFDVAWAEDIIDQCRRADVACFVKQLGARPYHSAWPDEGGRAQIKVTHGKGGNPSEWPLSVQIREFPAASTITWP